MPVLCLGPMDIWEAVTKLSLGTGWQKHGLQVPSTWYQKAEEGGLRPVSAPDLPHTTVHQPLWGKP